MFCDVASAAGTVKSAPVSNVTVVCAPVSGFAYVANAAIASGSIAGLSAYAIRATGGALLQLSSSPVATGVPTFELALTPNGKFLYASSASANTVTGFAADGTNGGLSAISGSPVATGTRPLGMSVDPNSQFLYVANGGSGSDSVSAYAINPATGVLTPITGSPFAAGPNPEYIAIAPNGQFLYVANYGANTISGYTLNGTTGALTPLAGSPFPAGTGVESLAIHPNGAFLYAAVSGSNNGSPAPGNVSAYAINAGTGALTAVTGSPFAAGSKTYSVALNPAGTFLYATNYDDDTVSAYTINSSTGALTGVMGSPFLAGAARAAYAVHVDLSGAFLYVTDGNVYGFSINSGSGALTPVAGGPFPTGAQPSGVAVLAPANTQGFAGVWNYGPVGGNQAVLIMDNAGNLTAFGLQNGAWFGYNGAVQISGTTASGTVVANFPAQATCESCAGQGANGFQPTANVTLTVNSGAGTIAFTDKTNNQSWTYTYLPSSGTQPVTSLSTAQASWNTLVSGGEPSYPHYAGWGNPYPVSAVGYGGLGNCLNSGTINSDVPALGIYILTCTQAYDAVNGIGVFNPSTVVVASGLVFMNVSGQIFGAMSDPGMFENVSYPAGVIQ